MGKFILVVDDNPEKLKEAEEAALAVFPDAEVRMLLFSRWGDTRTEAEIAWCIYQLRPDILILDNDLASRVHGTTVALRLRLLPGGRQIQIVMYTTEWEKGVRITAGRKPFPDVQLGAGNLEDLKRQLEVLKDLPRFALGHDIAPQIPQGKK